MRPHLGVLLRHNHRQLQRLGRAQLQAGGCAPDVSTPGPSRHSEGYSSAAAQTATPAQHVPLQSDDHLPPNSHVQLQLRWWRLTMRQLVSTTAGKPEMTGRKRSCAAQAGAASEACCAQVLRTVAASKPGQGELVCRLWGSAAPQPGVPTSYLDITDQQGRLVRRQPANAVGAVCRCCHGANRCKTEQQQSRWGSDDGGGGGGGSCAAEGGLGQ